MSRKGPPSEPKTWTRKDDKTDRDFKSDYNSSKWSKSSRGLRQRHYSKRQKSKLKNSSKAKNLRNEVQAQASGTLNTLKREVYDRIKKSNVELKQELNELRALMKQMMMVGNELAVGQMLLLTSDNHVRLDLNSRWIGTR